MSGYLELAGAHARQHNYAAAETVLRGALQAISYQDMVLFESTARLILTDSGGIQKRPIGFRCLA